MLSIGDDIFDHREENLVISSRKISIHVLDEFTRYLPKVQFFSKMNLNLSKGAFLQLRISMQLLGQRQPVFEVMEQTRSKVIVGKSGKYVMIPTNYIFRIPLPR